MYVPLKKKSERILRVLYLKVIDYMTSLASA